jgi:hypothetical protein
MKEKDETIDTGKPPRNTEPCKSYKHKNKVSTCSNCGKILSAHFQENAITTYPTCKIEDEETEQDEKDDPPIGKTLYKKNPLVIEAFQMTRKRRFDNSDWPEWLNCAWSKPCGEKGSVYFGKEVDADGKKVDADKDYLYCMTSKGECAIFWDDFIIKDENGDISVCDPDIFKEMYCKLRK